MYFAGMSHIIYVVHDLLTLFMVMWCFTRKHEDIQKGTNVMSSVMLAV